MGVSQFKTRWINTEQPGTIYVVKKEGYLGPVVEMIKTDGYTSKLRMTMNQLFDFEGKLLKNGWSRING